MKDIIKSLKDLGLEIVNSDSATTDAWLKTTSKLYEQLLLADYLEKRNASLKAIEGELVEKISQIVDANPIEIKQPEAPKPVASGLIKLPPQFNPFPVKTPEFSCCSFLYIPYINPISLPPVPISPAGTSVLGPIIRHNSNIKA